MRKSEEVDLWKLFFRIVERGSLSKAAEDLLLEPSSASRRIAALEKRLQVQLLHRSPRSLSLTSAGERAYEHMRVIIEDMEQALSGLEGGSPTVGGMIRLTAPVNFGERYVTTWLAAFQRRHPGVLFDLVLSDSRLDLMAEGIDVALRVGEMPLSDLVVKRLGTMPNIICASPAYLTLNGIPRMPSELASHRAVLYSLSKERKATRFRLEKGGVSKNVELSGSFFLNNAGAILRAVEDGVGIHAGPRWLFDGALSSGRLVQLLPDWTLPSMPVHLVRLKSRYVPQRISVLYEWFQHCWKEASLPSM